MSDLFAATAEDFIVQDESAEFFRYAQAFASAIEIGIYNPINRSIHELRL
jgi:hypothetical protein